ncbi:MAG TPA: universal stress protein [Candidatus Nitrosotenuis sp.]|nr:universal stress protein [Candidatus Nitrosotenuis sp.]
MSADTQIVCPKIDICGEVSPSLIKHVLVPFDESEISYHAFEFALDLAKKYQARLSVLTVMHSEILASSFLDVSSHQKIVERQRVKELSHIFRIMGDVAKRFNVSLYSDIILSRSVSDSIVAFCSQHKVNLIVMGTRSRQGSKRYLIGSVAIDVLQKASCPIIFVK